MLSLQVWQKFFRRRNNPPRVRRAALKSLKAPAHLEPLESRVLLYAASGNAWPNPNLITISFMPDGTNLGGATSNLFGTFNTKFGSAATWENQILKAAQYWAQQTNINFAVVPDNGAASGSGSYQQGDPGFGDIRIGGFNFGTSSLAQAYLPPPINNYSIAGDIQINTSVTFNVGSQYDLFTVMVHEFGHALGLNHATSSSACMYATYNGTDSALNSDDITGIKSIYSAGGTRAVDSYEANESTSAAKTLTLDSTTKALVVNGLDLTTSTDLDYFKIVVPSGATTTLKATVATSGLSLMSPKIEIIVGSKTMASAAAGATEYGVNKTATYTNSTDLAAGKTVYIKVSSANSIAAFKTGKYALILNMGTGTDPAYTKPSTQKANGSPLSSGGGVAIKLGSEALVNAASSNNQETTDRAVATSLTGGSVATWASQNQDGSGWGIYARLIDSNGVPTGSEFQVNTTTDGDQLDPSVAMDAAGNFVVTWTSLNQDGSGAGVYARRFSAVGLPLGDEFRVNNATTNDQKEPAVAIDNAGNMVFTWRSDGQDGSGSGVYARCYNSLGVSLGNEFRVNTTTSGDQSSPAVAVNRTSGNFIITWASAGQDGSGSGVYAQRYTGLLGLLVTAQGGEFRANSTTTNDQNDASVGINPVTGDFWITWTSTGQDGSGKGIYAQRYNSSGTAQGGEIRVNTSTTGDQCDPSVVVDAGGDVYVTWSNWGVSGAGVQVFGQQLERNGNKKEAEFVVNDTTAGDQKNASVAINSLGHVLVVWSGNGDGDGNGVYLQRYRTDLHPLEVEQHQHAGTGHDDDGPIPNSTANQAGLSSQDSHLSHEVQVSAADNGEAIIHRIDALERWKHAGMPVNPAQDESVSLARERVAQAIAKEFPDAIDAVFGSADWIAGRHYRSSSIR